MTEPLEFVARTRVLPLTSAEGTPLDVVFALLPFERDAITRAVARQVGDQPVRFCTAEDLVIMKIFSSRPRDLEDARAILVRNGPRLDHAYLEPRVRELASLLDNPGILEHYLQWRTL